MGAVTLAETTGATSRRPQRSREHGRKEGRRLAESSQVQRPRGGLPSGVQSAPGPWGMQGERGRTLTAHHTQRAALGPTPTFSRVYVARSMISGKCYVLIPRMTSLQHVCSRRGGQSPRG